MDYIPFMREPTLLEKAWMTVQYPFDLVLRPFNALLSIPALSFFVIPAFSSYSTTVNFFFFYLTWAVLIRSNDPLKVELLGSLGIRLVFYLLPSLGFLFFDTTTPSLAKGIKEHGDAALPMGATHGGWKGRWWKIALVSTANLLLGILLQLGVELLFTRVLHIRSALKDTTSPPFPWTIAKDIFLSLLLREILTYVLHRYILHSSKTRLSQWHVAWQHSVVPPFSFVAHYDNPVTYLLHVFLPTFIPALVLRLHLLTYHFYLILVSLEELFAYSGYNVLPTAFILGGIARRQEGHLMGNGDGNYGCIGLIDFALGTSVGTDLMDDVVEEAEDKEVGKKTRGKVKTMKRKAKKRIEPEREPEGAEDENEEEEEQEEEEAPAKKGRKPRKGETSDSVDNTSHSNSSTPSKRKSSRQSRKTKKASDEGEDGSADVRSDGDKVKRKPSSASGNGRKGSTRSRKKIEGNGE